MNRELRKRNTEYYEYTNVNPKNKYGGDCVVRAIALATGQSWADTIREMTELGIKMGFVLNDKHVYSKYLLSKGFVQAKEPRNFDNTKIAAMTFINRNKNKYGPIVAKVGSHHVTTIIDNKVHDTWDCSDQTMHIFWYKP